jgi:hypothetical protein
VKPAVYVLGFTVAIGGMIFGMDIGGSGGTFEMEGFKR